jgi:hypothetical protein
MQVPISGSKLMQNNQQEIKINANGVQIIHHENILYILFNPSTQLLYMNGTYITYMNKNNTINTTSKTSPFHTKNYFFCIDYSISTYSGSNSQEKLISMDINEAH